MLTPGLTGRIWVCVEPVDGRKSFDGLSAVVSTQLGRDPLSGDLFVFKNRRGDRLKILAWQGDTDDTPITLLNPRRTAYAWVYVGDRANPYTVFDLSAGHQ